MSANAIQVGGTHYQNGFQHWDLAHELDLGYFEGAITKYVTRYRKKNGIEDLRKARHLAEKLQELATVYGRPARHRYPTTARMDDYAAANGLTPLEAACIAGVCTWSCIDHLELTIDRIDALIQIQIHHMRVNDGGEATRGYVDQG